MQIGAGDGNGIDRQIGRLGLRRRQRVRVASPGQVIEQNGQRRQQHRVQQHRVQHKVIAHLVNAGAAEDGGQRHRAARRMQAAQLEHQADGHRRRRAAGQARIGDQQTGADAHRRRQRIAADDRPGLRQWAVGHAEQQHRRSAHRRDKPQVHLTQNKVADPAGEHQPQTGADAGNQHLSLAHRQRVRPQARNSHSYPFYPLRFHVTRYGPIHVLATNISRRASAAVRRVIKELLG